MLDKVLTLFTLLLCWTKFWYYSHFCYVGKDFDIIDTSVMLDEVLTLFTLLLCWTGF